VLALSHQFHASAFQPEHRILRIEPWRRLFCAAWDLWNSPCKPDIPATPGAEPSASCRLWAGEFAARPGCLREPLANPQTNRMPQLSRCCQEQHTQCAHQQLEPRPEAVVSPAETLRSKAMHFIPPRLLLQERGSHARSRDCAWLANNLQDCGRVKVWPLMSAARYADRRYNAQAKIRDWLCAGSFPSRSRSSS
jgi:hypothetical protein